MDDVTLGSGTLQDISDVLAFTEFKMCIFSKFQYISSILKKYISSLILSLQPSDFVFSWRRRLFRATKCYY